MQDKPKKKFWSRRDFLMQSGGGVAGLALASLMHDDRVFAQPAPPGGPQCTERFPGAFAPKPPHFTPRAKSVISLFMSGGPSQIDTFDYKPSLTKYAGQPLEDLIGEKFAVRQGMPGPLMPSPFEFRQYGESGMWVSELFPHLSAHVDDIAFVKSLYGRSNDHIQATYEMQTGQISMGFPSVGCWVTYGLGSESSSLPAFVVMTDHRGGPLGGPNDWGSGFMPASYQGTLFRSSGDPIVDLETPETMTPERQRARLEVLAELNRMDMEKYPGNSELAARISSYELAYRMQGCAPEAIDIRTESEATRRMYGLDDPITEPFGKQCLMARRLVERGVRFVQLFMGGVGVQNTDTWDAHSNLVENHTLHAARIRQTDRRADCRPEVAGHAGRHPDPVARGIRPHADFPAGRGTRPQSGRADRADDRRRHRGRPGDRRFGRMGLQGAGTADLAPRHACHDPAPAGPRSREADLSLQRPRLSSVGH